MKTALISIPSLLLLTGLAYADLNIELLGELYGENDGDEFGQCVADLGDMNGDGFEDFGVGAPDYPADEDSGRVCIYFGSESLDLSVDMVLDNPGGVKWLGERVCGLRDVNGDGYDEFLVSAWSYGVFLYFGGDPPDLVADRIYWEPIYGYGTNLASGDVNKDGSCDLVVAGGGVDDSAYVYLGSGEMDTIADFVLYGEQLGMDGLGIGDINGDGYDDIVASGGLGPSGYETYLFLGRDSLYGNPDLLYLCWGGKMGVGDVNGDECEDIVRDHKVYFGGAEPDSIYDLWLPKGKATAAVGFLNADAFGDIAIQSAGPFGWTSAVNIYVGGPAIDTLRDWFWEGEFQSGFGYSISCVDLNSDGVDEMPVGAPFWPSDNRRGRVLVFAGDTTSTSVDDETIVTLPSEIYLQQNYPNPFNTRTIIQFSVLTRPSARIHLAIYDASGRLVKNLLEMPPLAGINWVVWDETNDFGDEVASGVYFITLETGDIFQTRKAIVIR